MSARQTERWRGESIKDLPFAERIMAAKEGTVEEDGPDGVRELYAFTTLKGAQGAGLVRVIIGIPTKLAFAEADRFSQAEFHSLVVHAARRRGGLGRRRCHSGFSKEMSG